MQEHQIEHQLMANYGIYLMMGFIILQNPIKSVVVGCSAEYASRSINKELLAGPDMINQITGTLIRFRNGKWPLLHTQKISFLVSKEHRSLLHFLWWHDGDLSEKLIDHEMCVCFSWHILTIL